MQFIGTFNSYDNEQKYSITIGENIGADARIITDPTELTNEPTASDMIIMFDTDPITIACDRQDLIQRIMISQATINLVSNKDLTDYLFADTNRTIPVTINNITDPNNIINVFFGYVDPLQFSQGYAHNYETISITATDQLGALEYMTANQFQDLNPSLELSTENIISRILAHVGVTTYTHSNVNNDVWTAVTSTLISMAAFNSSTSDDTKSLYDILTSICKYFNLYIIMNGTNSALITCSINNTPTPVDLCVPITQTGTHFADIASDDSTSLSIDDVYSQISLTCNIEPVEEIVSSFDDSDYLYSDYDNYVKYMTEYWTYNPGEQEPEAWGAFKNLLDGEPVTYDNAFAKDHYMYIFRNDKWQFGVNGGDNYITALGGDIDYNTGVKVPMDDPQQNLLQWLKTKRFRCALIGFGTTDKMSVNGRTSDNSVKNNVTIDKYLVISTVGNFLGYRTAETFATELKTLYDNGQCMCKYRGIDSLILSPTDNQITNYIVISGSIILNPPQVLTGARSLRASWGEHINDDPLKLENTWSVAQSEFVWDSSQFGSRACLFHTVDLNDTKGVYYNQFWWNPAYTPSEPTDTSGGYPNNPNGNGIHEFLNYSRNKFLQYNYSAYQDTSDKMSKLPILSCRLKVGNKYCVEKLWLGEEGQNKFQWMTLQEVHQLSQSLGYENDMTPTFTIGINPAHGDYIIGQKHEISNNINESFNLDKTGMAIPITLEDGLSGTIEFEILGPYNGIWNTYAYNVNAEWYKWLYGDYDANAKSVLAYTSSIMVNNLKIEMASDNAGISSEKGGPDNDLVYYSVTNPTYAEKQEDDIDICTPLTLDERQRWHINAQTSNSYVYRRGDAEQGEDPNATYPFYGFISGTNTIKPEQCLIDYLYKEYCISPARILETQLKADAFANGANGYKMNTEMMTSYYKGLPIDKMYPFSLGDNIYSRIMSYNTSLKYKVLDVKFRQYKTIVNEQI